MSFSNRLGAFGYPAQGAFTLTKHKRCRRDRRTGLGSIVQSMIKDSERL
ncbi:MAG: hypothetical protein CM1200mP2_15650 [Planctomycetaceae bacterium]|nr:MAG: hypothetical protein CM1200mP2_15650 [Planctomycetaceae bacterium]